MSAHAHLWRRCWLLLLPLTVTKGAVTLVSFVYASKRAPTLAIRKHSCHSWGMAEGPQHQWRRRCAVETVSELLGDITHSGVNEAKLEEMERWLDKIGVDRGSDERGPAVRLKSFAERGVGLEAAVELERDSTVASIPRKVCLSSDADDASPGTLRALAHSLLASVPSPASSVPRTGCGKEELTIGRDVMVVTLQLFLECMAGARSELAPWIATLPREGDLALPALWPPHDLEPLKGTLVMREIDNCLARVAAERHLVEAAITRGVGRRERGKETDAVSEWYRLDNVDMKGRPTHSEWLHLRCIVQSRAYRMGNRYLLIPLVDFANHDDDVGFAVCPGDGVFTGLNEVVFSADRSYRPGQEVCTTYGDMDNAKRLFSFGFVTLNRPEKRWSSVHDALSLPTEGLCDIFFPLDDADPLRNLKESVLRQHLGQNEDDAPRLEAVFPLTPRRPLVSQLVDGPARSFVESAMPLLRLVALTPEEFRCEVLGDDSQFRHDSQHICTHDVAAHETDSVQECGWVLAEGAQTCDPPGLYPILAAEGGVKVLARLAGSVSQENERKARHCLAGQCCSRLQEIGLNPSDAEALNVAAREGCLATQSPKFTVTCPRRLLCAAVRVGEAIASYALLEAIACDIDSIVDIGSEGNTWVSWVLENCRSTGATRPLS